MKTFTVRIYQRWKSIKQPQLDSGLYPIKIQIVSKDENRKQKDIHTDVSCTRKVYTALFEDSSSATEHQMRDINKIRKNPENIELKRKVEAVYYKYYDIVKDITRENRKEIGILRLKDVLTTAKFEEYKARSTTFDEELKSLKYWFDTFLIREGSFLAKKYKNRIKSAKNSFCKSFKDGALVNFEDIDKDFLDQWQTWMRTPELQRDGKQKTFATIQGYAKDLKKVLEYVAETPSNFYKTEDIPIGKGSKKYQIPSAGKNEAKIPRYLLEEDLKKFKSYQPENEKEELAKDVWFLSYYLGGINMSDLVELKEANIQKDFDLLIFYRGKNSKKPSKTPSRVPLRKEAYELIEKYKSDGMFLLNFHDNSKNTENTSDNLRSRVNDEIYLKAISRKLEFKTSLNYQMARHTCSTNLMRNDGKTRMIQDVFGHANIKSTENYLSGFDIEEIRKVYDKI
tara:strand:+ start:213 stop:1574 length:1362 start_codon:yes stop_codon:yes gene_type:complete